MSDIMRSCIGQLQDDKNLKTVKARLDHSIGMFMPDKDDNDDDGRGTKSYTRKEIFELLEMIGDGEWEQPDSALQNEEEAHAMRQAELKKSFKGNFLKHTASVYPVASIVAFLEAQEISADIMERQESPLASEPCDNCGSCDWIYYQNDSVGWDYKAQRFYLKAKRDYGEDEVVVAFKVWKCTECGSWLTCIDQEI